MVVGDMTDDVAEAFDGSMAPTSDSYNGEGGKRRRKYRKRTYKKSKKHHKKSHKKHHKKSHKKHHKKSHKKHGKSRRRR